MTEARHSNQMKRAEAGGELDKLIASLPQPEGTKYPYDLVAIEGRTVFLAGQVPKQNGALAHVGKVGGEVSPDEAVQSARICAQQALSWFHACAGGLHNLQRILRITCYVAHDDSFSDISSIADGASNFLIEALSDRGRHVRSVIGVKSLPRNAPVLIEVTASLKSPLQQTF